MGPARDAERAPRWDATYPFRAERAERELRRLVVPTPVRLVGRRDPRRGHAVVGVHGRASVCFRRERGRRTRGGRCQSPRLASRVGRASRRSRLDESVRAPEASPCAWVLAPGGSRQSTHLLRARRLVRGRRRSGRVRRVYECVNRGVGGVRTHVAVVERTRGGGSPLGSPRGAKQSENGGSAPPDAGVRRRTRQVANAVHAIRSGRTLCRRLIRLCRRVRNRVRLRWVRARLCLR